jgi:uncharacterized NAD(P)/FAD-binding protein YdhS
MPALGVGPAELIRFARASVPRAHDATFLPREPYGDYLAWLLRSAANKTRADLRFESIQHRDMAVQRFTHPNHFDRALARRGKSRIDFVVLATGGPPPRVLAAAAAVRALASYADDPKECRPEVSRADSVLAIGARLTAVDVIAATMAMNRSCAVQVLSRHGLLPSPRADTSAPAVLKPALDAAQRTAPSVRSAVRAVPQTVRRAAPAGVDWRDGITQVRHAVPQRWQRSPARDRAQFKRYVQACWDGHRHRVPPPLPP